MNYEQFIPALAFMTLGFVLAFAIMSLVNVMRKRNVRQDTPMTHASEGKRSKQGSMFRE